MEQEDRFFAALQRVGKVQFAEGLLVLLDADDEVLLKANRRP
jgi:heat shock protein HslJ